MNFISTTLSSEDDNESIYNGYIPASGDPLAPAPPVLSPVILSFLRGVLGVYGVPAGALGTTIEELLSANSCGAPSGLREVAILLLLFTFLSRDCNNQVYDGEKLE